MGAASVPDLLEVSEESVRLPPPWLSGGSMGSLSLSAIVLSSCELNGSLELQVAINLVCLCKPEYQASKNTV